MVVSDITKQDLAAYLRIEYAELTEKELSQLDTLLSVAKAFILSHTGLTAEEIDTHEDFVIVIYVL
ncbi:MAG: hypothetical protein LLF94_09045, partial [Chlamydiales bacterium]|nr:hypothetical protein [Chlamydiales bacterium]